MNRRTEKEVKRVLKALEDQRAVEEHVCYGCKYEQYCSAMGCAVNRDAIALIKNLAAECGMEK